MGVIWVEEGKMGRIICDNGGSCNCPKPTTPASKTGFANVFVWHPLLIIGIILCQKLAGGV
jgi:hypothetical protein